MPLTGVTEEQSEMNLCRSSGQIQPAKPKRYHGSVILDSARVGRDAAKDRG